MAIPIWDRTKDPDEVVDYDLDWSAEIGDDTIVSSQWFPTKAAGLTINSNAFDDTATKVWLSGGTIGETATLTNRVSTAGGRTLEQSCRLPIRER
jgi:hypothetical protein